MKTNHRKIQKWAGNLILFVMFWPMAASFSADWVKPYDASCTERQTVFEFTKKPAVKYLGDDKYAINFSVKSFCDVTVAVVDAKGQVVRHLGSGVLGSNAPKPFQKNALKQLVYWDGKNDLEVYIKKPGTLKVRVMLGLKPTFDKRLGGTSPHNFPGNVSGLAVGPEGAVVFSKKYRTHIRMFDHDGKYVRALLMPAANLPKKKLGGMGYVEYESGRFAVQSPDAYRMVADRGDLFWGIAGGTLLDFQAAISNGKIYFVGYNAKQKNAPAPMYALNLDGSTEYNGVRGTPFCHTTQRLPRMVASPDGKWIYMVGAERARHMVLRRARTGTDLAQPFLGKFIKSKKTKINTKAGPGNDSFNEPTGIDCDAKGRIYVCDQRNNRIQIFSPKGDYLKSIPSDRPSLIQVHRKTGAIYILHTASVRGKSTGRLTKLKSFNNPTEVFHKDGMVAGLMALDSWSAEPRLWFGKGDATSYTKRGLSPITQSVVLFKEQGKQLKRLFDFDERAKKEDGPYYVGRWKDTKSNKLICDPVREKAYLDGNLMFDLPSGHFLGRWEGASHRSIVDDAAFDKRGYMHLHLNPTFYLRGAVRIDPSRPQAHTLVEFKGHVEYYPEVPYDYGVQGAGLHHRGDYWKGILALKDQPGPHGFQLGVGANMRGDLAVVSQIYYVPKMEESVKSLFSVGYNEVVRATGRTLSGPPSYSKFIKDVQDRQKKGEQVYSIRREPGIPLSGSTIWTFNATGELRDECAVNMANYINGIELDMDNDLYFTCNKIRLRNGTPYLAGKGGTFGGKSDVSNRNPMTGTLVKSRSRNVALLLPKAVIPMQHMPNRPPEVLIGGMPLDQPLKSNKAWIEGAKWMYAGASPFIFRACRCPQLRFRTDWYRRTFVPEAYRHSVGVVDTNGNLIMHIGRYGNFDSASGPKSKIPVGGDNIGLVQPRAIAATDNYIAITCRAETVTVLKIGYHAEETVALPVK